MYRRPWRISTDSRAMLGTKPRPAGKAADEPPYSGEIFSPIAAAAQWSA
jgi:hypothetical protein